MLFKIYFKLSVTEDDAKDAFQHVVKMRLSKIVAHGCPGSGKTSLLDLIMGKPPAATRQSTGCVEPHARAIAMTAISAKDWENFDYSVMLQKFCCTIRKVIEKTKEEDHTDERKLIDAESMTLGFLEEKISDVNAVMTNDKPSPIASSASAQSDIELENSDLISKSVGMLLEELSNVEGSDEFMDAHLVLTVDSGGQHQFQDVSPLFLGSNSIFLITVKLNERLNAKSTFSYYVDGESIEISRDDLHLTYLEVIKLLAQYVLSIMDLRQICPVHPKIMVVGTFEDKVGDCDETVKEKNDLLKKHLKDYTKYCVLNENDIIFPVNSMEPDPEIRTIASEKFQGMIIETLRLTDAYDIPVSYFGLLLVMINHANQKHGRDPALEDKEVKNDVPVLTLSECIQIGKLMNMNEKEVKDALELFHNLNVLLYFPKATKLNTFVFIEIMPILKKLSSLIGISFIDNKKLIKVFQQYITRAVQDILRHQGCFDKELLEKFFNFSDPFTADLFLDLLEHLKIVAPIQRGKFFLPCALLHATEDMIDKRIQQQSSPHLTAWILRLKKKESHQDEVIPIPNGYFPALAVHLLSSQDITVKLPNEKVLDGKYHRQYRNVMTFSYGPVGFIHLIERPNYLEVHFSHAAKKQHVQECFNIRNAMHKASQCVEESLCLSADIEKEDAFFCFCNDHKHLHFCAVSQSQESKCGKTGNAYQLFWKCDRTGNAYYQLSENQRHWLEQLPASKLN